MMQYTRVLPYMYAVYIHVCLTPLHGPSDSLGTHARHNATNTQHDMMASLDNTTHTLEQAPDYYMDVIPVVVPVR